MSHTFHLIAISRYVTDYYSKLLSPEAKVYYVPNAIDKGFFCLQDMSEGRIIFFAGRVIPRKRVLDLVKAFAKIIQKDPSVQLRIAGESNSEASYVASVRRTIRNLDLEDRVYMLGQLDENAMMREFSKCSVLALPSVQETAPMVIAQAMAAAKPVVATPVGGVAEMVRDGETGILVHKYDIHSLADSLLQLLKNPLLRVRMGQRGRKIAVQNYHQDIVAQNTHDVYRKIAALKK
jgi:glycosyltransferase involved in cell wall biosynthesis